MEFATVPDQQQQPAEAPQQDHVRSLRDAYKSWPQKGGFKDDQGNPHPEPWDIDAHNLDPRTFPKGGEPDEISPVPIDHGKPILGALSREPAVLELGQQLGRLGYHNSISRGENPSGALDNSVLQAAQKFRSDFAFNEEPTEALGGFGPEGQAQANRHVGPYTWEALRRVQEDPGAHGAQ